MLVHALLKVFVDCGQKLIFDVSARWDHLL
jgi:hypothetical protein